MTRDDLVLTPLGLRHGGRTYPCAIGRGGVVAAKREGDGATPMGRHRITGLLYRPDRLSRRAVPYWGQPIGLRDLWCDDPVHEDYNLMVRAPFVAGHERLRRADPLYDIVLTTDFNWPRARRGGGSAIFLHVWRGPRYPTAGCVALRRDHLLRLLWRLGPGTRLIVAPTLARGRGEDRGQSG